MTESELEQTSIPLINSMHGNNDATIKLSKTFTAHITDNKRIKMTQSKSDPYVFFKLYDREKFRLIVSITVDDCAITGKNEDIKWFMNGIKKRFKITRDGIIKKHLGVRYEWGKTKDLRNFCKAVMNKKIEATINHYAKYIGMEPKIYRIPVIPH